LRFAVERSEFATVIAATFDGAQRLANVERLFTLAERFERSGAHLIRDFVRYVEEFEAIGSRESEGQIDEATNAVKLMTIHQAKGLEFPIVIIPDLQRSSRPPDNWVLLDRQQGLTLKVPDGRGGSPVAGLTFNRFEKRHAWREQFESMRLLYVAATRAEDRLILSGAMKELDKLNTRSGTWLQWIWQSLELPLLTNSGVVYLTSELQLQVTLNLAEKEASVEQSFAAEEAPLQGVAATAQSIAEAFPLLGRIEAERSPAIHRFSVTQLINYQRCPRQYYFDRVLHAPAGDAVAVWNNAEAPEPPANLTATLKGAVIHRFCETYSSGDDPEERLRKSFVEILSNRQAELAGRMVEIDKAIAELLPLANNYLSSGVFERVERARAAQSGGRLSRGPDGTAGLWSELSFRLRRPLGILSGAIDKLLITPIGPGEFEVEIIDFKTNRLSRGVSFAEPASDSPRLSGRQAVERDAALDSTRNKRAARSRSRQTLGQFAFDFNAPIETSQKVAPELSLDDRISSAASDYQLQMQAYALAVRELVSFLPDNSRIISTLHFLEPNSEFHLKPDLLSAQACELAIDAAMMTIVSANQPSEFPVHTASHCRMCNFLSICTAGREHVRQMRQKSDDVVNLRQAKIEVG
jgi:ATP-dependent helicase/nuclease subunit A